MNGASNRLLRISDVIDRVGLSSATIYRHIRAGVFPEPIHVGSASRWPSKEIDAWIEACCDRQDSPPESTVRSSSKEFSK